MTKVLLTHTPQARRQYYGERSLTGLQAIALHRRPHHGREDQLRRQPGSLQSHLPHLARVRRPRSSSFLNSARTLIKAIWYA